jgi:hypothetical protein
MASAQGPFGADGAAGGVLLRAADDLGGRLGDRPAGHAGERRVLRPAVQRHPGRRVPAGAVGGGGGVGDRRADRGRVRPVHRRGSRTLAADLLPSFELGMLVLADRNFLSHALARDVLATGAHILWRASASFALRPVTTLADDTYLAEFRRPRKSDGPPVTYTVHTATTGERTGLSHPQRCSPWSPTCSTQMYTRRWTWPAPTRCAVLRDSHRPPQDRHGRRTARAAQ